MASLFASATEEQILSINDAAVLSPDYSTCVVYAKKIIHLSVGESGGYLPPLR